MPCMESWRREGVALICESRCQVSSDVVGSSRAATWKLELELWLAARRDSPIDTATSFLDKFDCFLVLLPFHNVVGKVSESDGGVAQLDVELWRAAASNRRGDGG